MLEQVGASGPGGHENDQPRTGGIEKCINHSFTKPVCMKYAHHSLPPATETDIEFARE